MGNFSLVSSKGMIFVGRAQARATKKKYEPLIKACGCASITPE
jgi:hypothetical protein